MVIPIIMAGARVAGMAARGIAGGVRAVGRGVSSVKNVGGGVQKGYQNFKNHPVTQGIVQHPISQGKN